MKSQIESLRSALHESEAARNALTQEVVGLRAKLELMQPLFERVMTSGLAPAQAQAQTAEAFGEQETLRHVHEMTLKQRAVLFASLAGHTYQEIADAMGVDVTTAKLHMRSALNRLGIQYKANLMAVANSMRDALVKAGANDPFAFGITLDWMSSPSPALLNQLRPTRKVAPPPGGKKPR